MNKEKQEILNPRERFGLLVIDEQPDRCNVIPLITSHAASVCKMKLKDYYTDGRKMAYAQIAAYEKYGHDAFNIFSEVGIIAEAMGSEFIYPDDDLPILKIPAVEKIKIDSLQIPDPEKDKRLPLYLDAINYIYHALGDRVPILAYVPAPFTTGMMLSEPSNFLMQTIRDQQTVYKIMDKALLAAQNFCYHIINAGALPVIVDPLASASVISPRLYRKFALPYERKLIRYLHRYDLDIILHICGDTEPILHLLNETEADLISIDRVDLSLVINKLSDQMRIIGNFDTSELAFSDPAQIKIRVQTMVKNARHANKGYIAATGCEVPIKTPQENVKAFVNSAKEVGWYWE